MIKEGVMLGGRYQIAGRIGTGGMADVYKAIDIVLNRYVAVKVLKSEFREDQTFVQKFRSEAQAAAGLTHPNIVNVYDVAEDRGVYYIVMELVEGITLKDYIQKKGQLSAKEVIGIAVQVCSGIDMAHSHGIIHRDIKPQNIMISKEGKVKVTDFGIAKATTSNTISTNAMGSVHYTSPEQARGGFSDAKSDIYSLGITMYEMITGRLPFEGDSTVSIALKHLQEEMVVPSEYVPNIPFSLESIILKCTQKSPDRRYGDMSALMRDLKRSLQEPDGDFVKIAPSVSVADTVMISQEELEQIQTKSEYRMKDADVYSDDYDDEHYDSPILKKRAEKKSEINPKMAKIMKILTIIVAAIFVFILVYALGSASGIFQFGPGITVDQEQNEVPELVGMPVEEARELCEKLGYSLKVSYEESDKYDEGIIIYQKTAAGTKLDKGGIIPVILSSGLVGSAIEVPNVKNMTEQEARDALANAGFTGTITVATREDEEVAIEHVIGTTPDIGSMAPSDTSIVILLSSGKSDQMIPNLENKTKDVAISTLEAKGFVAEIEEVYNDTVEAGIVMSQDIEYGEFKPEGTVVKLIVSKGPEPVAMATVPTGLAGHSYSSAKAAILNAGLVPSEKYEVSTEYNEGIVIGVEGEGTEVEKGSLVVIRISTGPGPSVTPDSDTDAGAGE